jgi:peptidoglycan/LPS O-acetylase OafA/YrhL
VAHAGLYEIVPGRLGVNIFFLLSGYLITSLMIREQQKTGYISLRLFYIRRSLRIFPTMYAITAVTILYLWLVGHLVGVTVGGLCSELFYYQNYFFSNNGLVPGLGVMWSLAVEEHFYILFPPLMLLFIRVFKMNYQQIAWTLLALCGCILAWRTFVVFHFTNGLEWASDTTDCRADSILYGCALACWEQNPSAARLLTRARLERFILPAAIFALLGTLVYRDLIFRETLRYSIQGIALAFVLYYVVHMPDSLAGRILGLRWLSFLGALSYALYLLHFNVLTEINLIVPSHWIAGVISLGVSIFLAYLFHVSIERPMERIRRNFRHKPETAPRVLPSATLNHPLALDVSAE